MHTADSAEWFSVFLNGKGLAQTGDAVEYVDVICKDLLGDGLHEDLGLGIGYVQLPLGDGGRASEIELSDLLAFGLKGILREEGKISIFQGRGVQEKLE